ncbi:hypothetical protein NYG90_08765 [Helicobacter sp. XJK30-2]|uniref:Uncharacterized protein n=1 Tax=Helicobacter zhangjianzhongii TaxID=2974574 RepID=A0ACC6FVU9_9HELI|nr:hypothetical protein [Helicobacter sp. XJK30-2]MDL0082756.1 hypothetical protein [Helicobacter sp. XJK30-2]
MLHHTATSYKTGGGGAKNLDSSSSPVATFVFFAFLCCYAFIVFYDSAFAVIDDHTLIQTLLIGQNIPLTHHIIPEIGRFYPLDGQDLNVLSAIFGASASVFYGFNALCVLVVGLCLSYAIATLLPFIAPHTKAPKTIAYILVALLLLTPAFCGSWFRLFVPERMEFVFLSIMLASYAFVANNRGMLSVIVLIIGGLSAMIACFYKETAFILIGSFAFTHLLLTFLNKRSVNHRALPNRKLMVFDVLLLCACVVWVVAYYVFVIAQKTTSGRYGDTLHNPLIVFAKNLFTYIMNEPFLFVLVPLLCFYRVFVIVRAYKASPTSSPFIPILDSSLCACAAFMGAYLVLNISSAHYPLPGYIFGLVALSAIPALWTHLSGFVRKVFAVVIALCVGIFVSNSLFYSAHTIAHYKASGQNLQSTLAFFSSQNKPVSIMLEGVDCTLIEKSEVCYSFEKWLEYAGVKATIVPDRDMYNPLRKSLESTFEKVDSSQSDSTKAAPQPQYLILTPYSSNFVNSEYIAHLDSTYKRIYHADFGLNLGFVGIKTLMKYALAKDSSNLVFSGNIWNLPAHFYVYELPQK